MKEAAQKEEMKRRSQAAQLVHALDKQARFSLNRCACVNLVVYFIFVDVQPRLNCL